MVESNIVETTSTNGTSATTARQRSGRWLNTAPWSSPPALSPRQSVYESVAEGIRLHKRVASDAEGRSEVALVSAALAEAGLRPPEGFFLRYPHELSGGQKQRVLIAGALA